MKAKIRSFDTLKTPLGCPFCRDELDQASIGAEAKAHRLKLGIPQNALAAAMEISAAYLCELEVGRRPWTPIMIEKYIESCQRLGLETKPLMETKELF